ncbi:DUF5050 domain-containing protein, partial [bacterium]|nr:DUF5050 domain-containing protein [bacterium]
LPETLPSLSETGWKFEGWYTKDNYEESSKAVPGATLTANITLYAKWTDLSKKTITGITFESKTVMYNGNEQSVLISGTLPTGVTARYTNNKAINAGVYNASVTLSGEGYNPLTLTATLTISKATFTGLSFEDATFTYDASSHDISVEGTLPANTTISYSCLENSTIKNTVVNAGVYHITASVTNPNYTTATFDAVLTVNKATIVGDGISFTDEKFGYDGMLHTIEVVGQLPEGSTVTYTCAENSSITNTATETGTYTITATITNPNYETKVLTAKLQITASDKERHIVYHNNTLYFANALDNDRLYSYADDTLTRISFDVPYYFTAKGNNLYFQSHSLLSSSIKEIGSSSVSTLASLKGDYLCTDGTNLYYAVNGLTNNSSGIYKVNPNDAEPTAELLSVGKAKYLKYYAGYLYFADGTNDNKLSKISTTTSSTRTVVVDEKITCLTINNGVLYFTVNKLLGDYIAKYTLSTEKLVKLTSDAGADLTVVGDELYYLNVDLLNSAIYGKGIYKVSATRTSDSSAVGTKVIGEENENYSSLTLANNQLAYYKVSTQMLCLYNITTGAITEVLDGFTAPEVTPLSTGSKTVAYKNTLYYLDLYNDKALYAVNTVTNARNRITSNKVSDFTIIGDTLYFNQVSYGVNNDLYKVDLVKGGEPELVSKNDCVDVVSDGTNLYYVEKNAAGVRTAIHKIDASGVDTMLYSKGAEYLTYYKGNIYFVDGKDLLRISVTDSSNTVVTVKKGNMDTFVIHDDFIYYRHLYGVGQKKLCKMNLDGTNIVDIMVANTDPLKIVISDNTLYYYTDTVLGTSGIYSISLSGSGEAELILERKTQYYAEDFTVFNGNIYFVNYYNTLGDSHLYKVNISTKTLERVD